MFTITNQCQSIVDQNFSSIVNIVLGWFLSIGTIISYIPQVFFCICYDSSKVVAFIQAKSNVGVSWPSFLVATIQSWAVVVNSVILQWPAFICCTQVVGVLILSSIH
jgi:hypothetical protein